MAEAKTKKSTSKKAAKKVEPASNTAEAKSRFNAALDEAKAGAIALKAEASERAGTYRDQARGKSDALLADAREYSSQAKSKAGELAVEGKKRTSDAIASLAGLINDSAPTIDDNLGAKFGDYARSASKSLQSGAEKLDAKSLDEIGEDAREFVRKSPGTAIGIAAVAGFLLARLFRGGRD